ncbi:hypothetical protein ACQP1W_17420 [Spirillospora sp. CA-255316]
MTSLSTASVLQIEQLSSQLEYRIADEAGQDIGRAVQVAGPTPRKGLLGIYGSGLGDARVVLEVGGPDGAPMFYVDRKGGSPVAIVAADGAVIGRFVYDVAATARSMLSGSRFGFPGAALAHRLWDARDRPVGEIDWEVKGNGSGRVLEALGGVCTDMDGGEVAKVEVREKTFKDRYTLRFLSDPPEPLRTLVVAMPLALDLTRS